MLIVVQVTGKSCNRRSYELVDLRAGLGIVEDIHEVEVGEDVSVDLGWQSQQTGREVVVVSGLSRRRRR